MEIVVHKITLTARIERRPELRSAPVITGVTPPSVVAGGSLTIAGERLTGDQGTEVWLYTGGTRGRHWKLDITDAAPDKIVCTVPDFVGPRAYELVVYADGRSSAQVSVGVVQPPPAAPEQALATPVASAKRNALALGGLARKLDAQAAAIHRRVGAGEGDALDGSSLWSLLDQSLGQPLPGPMQSSLQGWFGADLSGVRVHTDPPAQRAARALGAEAFAAGDSIYFAQGRLDASPRGQALLGHEVTHVVQAREGRVAAQTTSLRGLAVTAATDPLEAQALGNERAIFSGLSGGRAGGIAAAIQRKAQAGSELTGAADRAERFSGSIQRKARGGMVRRSGFFARLFGGGADLSVDEPGPAGEIRLASLTLRWAESEPVGEVQRKASGPGMELAREVRAAGGEAGGVPAGFVQELRVSQGTALPRTVEEQLEALLGADFSRVRVHTDPSAAAAAELVGAHAFTLGEDIYFNLGRYAPNSAQGMALIAHELTHVAQGQGGAPTLGGDGRGPVAVALPTGGGLRVAGHDALEHQAEANERAVFHAMTGAGGRWGGPPTFGDLTAPGLGLDGGGGFGAPAYAGAGQGAGFGGGTLRLRSGYPGALALSAEDEAGGAVIVPEVSDGQVNGLVELFKTIGSGLATAADIGIGFVPIVGDVYDVLCGLVGRAIFTWEKLDVFERLLCFVGVIPIPFISGAVLRRGKKALSWLISEKRAISILAAVIDRALQFVRTTAGRVKRWILDSKLYKAAIDAGKLAGRVVAKAATSVMSAQDLIGIQRTIERIIHKRFVHYHPTDATKAIKESGQIGKDGAVGAFATPMDPLLGASDTLVAKAIRMGMTGGDWDFVRDGWKLKATKKEMGSVTEFTGGDFTGANLAKVEKGAAFKQIFLQKAGVGPQQVEIIAQRVLAEHGLPDGVIKRFSPLISGALSLVVASGAVAAGAWLIPRFIETAHIIGDLLMNLGAGVLWKERAGSGVPRRLRELTGRAQLPLPGTAAWEALGGRERRRLARIHARMETLDQPGLPLEWSLRNRLERAVGADLSGVRLHTGADAEELAGELEAHAFALGRNIVLGAGSYRPDTPEGLGTLVHEATHVVQDQRGDLVGPASDARTRSLEAEAYGAERRFLAESRLQVAHAAAAPTAPAWSGPAPKPEFRHAPGAQPVEVAVVKQAVPEALSKALRKEVSTPNQTADADPVLRVMEDWRVSGMSRDEFLEECRERLIELIQEEVLYDSQRRETSMAWNPYLPMP